MTPIDVSKQESNLFSITGSRTATINDLSDNIGGDAAPADQRVAAGGFALKAAGVGDFLAWCLDITNYFDLSASPDYQKTDTPFASSTSLSQSQIDDVKTLFDTGYQSVLDTISSGGSGLRATTAAGFQIALWELVFEATSDRDVTDDDFFVTGTSQAVVDAATGFLAGMSGPATGNYKVIFLESQHPHIHKGQNLVTVAPVPLPAAGLLLVGALGGLGYVARCRKAA